jgi:hypothetical protein
MLQKCFGKNSRDSDVSEFQWGRGYRTKFRYVGISLRRHQLGLSKISCTHSYRHSFLLSVFNLLEPLIADAPIRKYDSFYDYFCLDQMSFTFVRQPHWNVNRTMLVSWLIGYVLYVYSLLICLLLCPLLLLFVKELKD